MPKIVRDIITFLIGAIVMIYGILQPGSDYLLIVLGLALMGLVPFDVLLPYVQQRTGAIKMSEQDDPTVPGTEEVQDEDEARQEIPDHGTNTEDEKEDAGEE